MSHLSYEQRYTIEVLLKTDTSKNSIAKIIEVDKSVVYREIKRNSDKRNGVYKAKLADIKYRSRQSLKHKHITFTADIEQKVRFYLQKDYSPEQISGVFKRDGIKGVSYECIYQFIWADKRRNGQLYLHLRRKGRKYRKRGSKKDTRGIILNRRSINLRPKEADLNTLFGHLEVDTIIGANHKGAIVTMNDRASGTLWMRKVEKREAKSVSKAIISMLEPIKPYIRSITADNGKEFAQHQIINDNYCDFFFADPYSPWQRGANENLNGLVMQYIPKSSDILSLSNERILEIQNIINDRPRKRYKYQNPIFVMENLLFNPEVAFVT